MVRPAGRAPLAGLQATTPAASLAERPAPAEREYRTVWPPRPAERQIHERRRRAAPAGAGSAPVPARSAPLSRVATHRCCRAEPRCPARRRETHRRRPSAGQPPATQHRTAWQDSAARPCAELAPEPSAPERWVPEPWGPAPSGPEPSGPEPSVLEVSVPKPWVRRSARGRVRQGGSRPALMTRRRAPCSPRRTRRPACCRAPRPRS
jgi:hypothetical protein